MRHAELLNCDYYLWDIYETYEKRDTIGTMGTGEQFILMGA